MTNVEKFQGILPAFYACYEDNGEVSVERTKALVRYFIEAGVQGLYVNGSSGECIYLSVEDRKSILEWMPLRQFLPFTSVYQATALRSTGIPSVQQHLIPTSSFTIFPNLPA